MKFWPTNVANSLLFFALLVSSIGCKKKDDNLGLEIQPQEDQLNVVVSDTTALITYSTLQDSIRTDELSGDNLIGSYVDPYFGKIKTAIFAQLRLSAPVDFTPASGNMTDLVIDSVRMYLKLSSVYGNNQTQTIEVYQLNNPIYKDSSYYSTSTVDSMPTNLIVNGQGNITPQPFSLGTVEGEYVDVSIVTLPLDNTAFGWNIINQSGTGVLNGNDGTGEFVEWFKGILIKSNNPSQNVNEGGILNVDLLSEYSKVVIFYRDTVAKDTIAYDLNFNSQSARFHRVTMNYNGFYVGNELADSTLGQDLYFTQTMGGVKANIAFPNLKEYIKDKKVIVNKAELVLPVQYYPLDVYLPSEQLFITRTNEDGNPIFIEDFTENFGGAYDIEKNEYVFNITRYINNVFAGEHDNLPISIVPNKTGISANRVVFTGQGTMLKDKPRLVLTFTKY